MLLTLAEIKQQCGMSQTDDTRDGLLTLYAQTAQKFIEHKTGRCMFDLKANIPIENGWYVSLDDAPDLKLAMLLLVTHFNDNPSATTEVSTRTMPFSVNQMVSPYIVFDSSILPPITS